jgi:uncharacterized protein YpbB
MTTQIISATTIPALFQTEENQVSQFYHENKASIESLLDQYIHNVIVPVWNTNNNAIVVSKLPPTLSLAQSTITLASRGFTLNTIDTTPAQKTLNYLKSMLTGKSYDQYLISIDK